ncbi:hypothetical protein ACFLV0_00385 [Chloroflexota bacterium]
MVEIIALIDKLIKEHKVIKERVRSIEQVANDASLLDDLADAKDTFVPGRFDQTQQLQELQEYLEKIDPWLQDHFCREETVLLVAVERDGDRKFIMALHDLLLEHEDLKYRVTHAREHVTELRDGKLGRHQWEASANDMRAHLSHTRKLLEAHAKLENDFFRDLRRHLETKMVEGSRHNDKANNSFS